MKHMKKLVSVLLTMVMVLAMTVVASAAGDTPTTYKITINNTTTGHTYQVYQIFTGDLSTSEDDKKVLSNVQWGDDVTYTGEGVVTGKDEAGNDVYSTSASDIADALSDGSLKLEDFIADLTLNKTTKEVESTASSTVIDGLVAGYYLVKDKDDSLTGSETYTKYIVQLVGDATVNVKSDVPTFEKKLKDTNDTTGVTSDWQDSADYDIGDTIPFKLEGTVASNYDDYSTYYFAFHDVEEEGLTFDSSSVKVYVDNTPITSGYTVVTDTDDGCTFEVIFDNLKDISSVHAGSVITVEYESTLNANAILGEQGNVNKAKLEFSNNPNEEQSGADKPETGETPWDNVIVFTYEVIINKVDGSNEPLTGAKFTLEKVLKDGTKETIAVIEAETGATFTFEGLDDGNYILTETETPEGYNTIDPITFTVTADHTITWDGENRTAVLTSLSGNKVEGEITLTADKSEGSLSANVVNQAGNTLPETGGMGTTIFYVLGSILVLGAAVLLITRKRMGAQR
ncbi:MAG: isopeptide-forming domain-containing fimbrial protein [Lachnospiraceae bacterium]